MNVKLLRKIQQEVLAEPRRLRMVTFGKLYTEADVAETFTDPADAPPCNMAACIGGFADWLTKPKLFKRDIKRGGTNGIGDRARKELGLTEDQADRLFFFREWGYEKGWPARFSNAYRDAKTPLAKAKVAVARIDAFIESGGKV
jgi:hypothetical protein